MSISTYLAPIENFSTLALKGNDVRVIDINSVSELSDISDYIISNEEQYVVIGEGSNSYFSDSYDGLVLKNNLKGKEYIGENETHVFVKAASGENWDQFVSYTINRYSYGLENLAAIPGTVGAAPVQNIGAYGVEVCEFIDSVEVFDFKEKISKTFNSRELQFGYRNSVFKKIKNKHLFITSVTFKLKKSFEPVLTYDGVSNQFEKLLEDERDSKSLYSLITQIRWSKLPNPVDLPNTGSFFKNPTVSKELFAKIKNIYPEIKGRDAEGGVKLAAAQLIELSGCKSLSNSSIGLYPKHALILVNNGESTVKDLNFLVSLIKQRVRSKYGINLEQEVCCHGSD